MFVAYNLSRYVNIIGVSGLIKALKNMHLPLFNEGIGLFKKRLRNPVFGTGFS